MSESLAATIERLADADRKADLFGLREEIQIVFGTQCYRSDNGDLHVDLDVELSGLDKGFLRGWFGDHREDLQAGHLVFGDWERGAVVNGLVATAEDLAKLLPSIAWEWPGWLPRGFVCLLVGEGGVGKSYLGLHLGRCLIEPRAWPDGAPGPAGARRVLWCDTEAAQALLNERIQRWKLPRDRILLPGYDPLASISLSNIKNRQELVGLLKDHRPTMLVVDSLSGSHSGEEISNRDMKRILEFLAKLARDLNIVVLVVHHVRKRALGEGETITLDRVRGASVISQFARVVLALEKVKGKLRVSVIKSNLALPPEPLGVAIHADGLTFGDAPEPPVVVTPMEAAVTFLQEALAGGPMAFKDLRPLAEAQDISKRMLYKAKSVLNIQTINRKWTLPR